nr:hypothetical protein [Gammaproteobacteria bacterium]
MKPAILTFDQTPAFSIPVRFFLAAPLFGVMAAVTLIYYGPSALTTRWSAATLALTHLLTLGYLAQIMVGAMIQLLAVLAGSPLPRPHMTASIVYVTLIAGVLLLTSAFFHEGSLLSGLALGLIATGFGSFVAGIVWSLSRSRSRSRHPSVRGMSFATVGLVITVLLGLYLGAAHSGLSSQPTPTGLTDVHAAWGLLGWVMLLVMSVAYQVVPMFQSTPDYPVGMTRWLVPSLFVALLTWSASELCQIAFCGPALGMLHIVSLGSCAAAVAAFAVVTLGLQQRRRRRMSDVTLWSWRVAMASALMAAGLWTVGQVLPSVALDARYPIALGVLMLVGFAMAVVNGMLYKIVPFLVWLHTSAHLKRQGRNPRAAPRMQHVIPPPRMRDQFWMQQIGFMLLLWAVLWPSPWVYPAGVMLAVSSGMLWWNLLSATRLYQKMTR